MSVAIKALAPGEPKLKEIQKTALKHIIFTKKELQSSNEELMTLNEELSASNEELDKSRRFAETTLATLHEPMLLLDNKFCIKSANKSFYKTFKLTETETLGKVIFQLQDNRWDIPGLREEFIKIQKEKEKLINTEIAFTFPAIGERVLCINICPVNTESGEQLIIAAFNDITSRKNEERLLKMQHESDARFRMLTNAMPVKISTKDACGNLNYLNQQWLDYTNKRFEELKGAGWEKIIHPNDLEINQQALKHSINTGEDFKLEQRFLCYDGTYRWHLSQEIAQKDEKGRTMMWIGSHTDIDEHKLVAEKVRIAEEFNRNVLQSSPECVKVLDEEGRVIFMNDNGFCQMDIEDFNTIKNKHWWELWGKENRQLIELAIAKGFRGDTAQFQALQPTFKGVPKWWDVLVSPVTSTNGKVTQLIAVSRDITSHKKFEDALAESEKRFREMANDMPQKVWTTDAHATLNYFNKRWVNYTNISFEELVNGGWKKIIHPDDWKMHQETWTHSIKTGEDYQLEERVLNHDGTYHWHLSRGHAQKDSKGEVMMWVGTNTDIDEQKTFEEELKNQIAERIKLETQKNQFISMASHELKTPLTSLKGYTQVLKHKFNGESNKETVEFLGRMDKQIDKLTLLINDLLESSKVKQGELVFNEGLFDFNDLIKETIDNLQHTTKSHIINLKLEATYMIFGDSNRIGQVMGNMLSNAIKYSPNAKEVNVTTAHKNNTIYFCVHDFGIGISPENQSHVFEQFYRVSGRVEDTIPGLGLGMFISSEIIKKSHGTMSVESEVGKGSSFCFTLPLRKVSKINLRIPGLKNFA